MSHYDEAYEAEEEQRRKEYHAACLAALSSLGSFKRKLSNTGAPQRFRDSLEDLENWLNANKGSSK